MKNLIQEYLELDSNEKKILWNNATFIFDANVFLNLYRYSTETRQALIKSMETLRSRIWIPAHIILEFMENRYDVIYQTAERYVELDKEIQSFINRCYDVLRMSSSEEAAKDLHEYLNSWLRNHKDRNLLVYNPTEDSILQELLILLDGNVGKPYSDDKLQQIKAEGVERYKKQIPPGYKDNSKATVSSDNNCFGDLIVWKEIIDYAKDKHTDVIFVTHDQKEDWWNRSHGKTIGPRIELRKEFCSSTNKKFHMYNMNSFLQQYEAANKQPFDKGIIDEVISIGSENSIMTASILKNKDKQKLDRLENGIRKRWNAARNLERKYGPHMPESVRETYENTINNMHHMENELIEYKNKFIME